MKYVYVSSVALCPQLRGSGRSWLQAVSIGAWKTVATPPLVAIARTLHEEARGLQGGLLDSLSWGLTPVVCVGGGGCLLAYT